jgi:hypothetical protein
MIFADHSFTTVDKAFCEALAQLALMHPSFANSR